MVIDADELDLGGVFVAIGLVVIAIPVLGLLLAMVAVRIGWVRRGPIAFALGILTVATLAVDVVVGGRLVGGDATGWDLVWAIGLTSASVIGWWRCSPPSPGTRPER